MHPIRDLLELNLCAQSSGDWVFLTRMVFDGDELGIAKPNSRFFDFVRRDFLPNEVLHVGDDIIADIQGATAAGIRAVLVDRSGKYSQGARCEVTNSLVTLFDDL